MASSRIAAFLVKELKEVLPPTLFFAIGFCIIELTTQLILDDYLVRFANYMVAVGVALVVGKAVLVANLLPFLRRFDTAPLIWPVLFKSVVYTIVVFLVRFLERLVEYWLGEEGPVRSRSTCRRTSSGIGLAPISFGFSFCS
jgi:hypothetical protein